MMKRSALQKGLPVNQPWPMNISKKSPSQLLTCLEISPYPTLRESSYLRMTKRSRTRPETGILARQSPVRTPDQENLTPVVSHQPKESGWVGMVEVTDR